MKGNLQKRITRFRAYQLGNPGSSFSYFDGKTFTLIEARLTDLNLPRVITEMEICGVDRVGCLHITSWDADHCEVEELKEILNRFRPKRIEFPGYPPKSDTATECLALIRGYHEIMSGAGATAEVQSIDPPFIASLDKSQSLGYRDIFYHPKYLSGGSNNNSTVKLFRTVAFNVASLGDVEDPMIAAYLRNCGIFSTEVDVMILAHHGADNGFTSKRFLKAVRPSVAICSSNYDNQYEHPREEIREMLGELGIPFYTTKTGDVAIQSLAPHTHAYRLINLKADSEERSSEAEFVSKKSEKLSFNMDTIRNLYGVRPTFPR